MDRLARLTVMKQNFERLLAMSDPRLEVDWRPTETQRRVYVQLAEGVLSELDHYTALERRGLLKDGQIHSYIPESMLSFVRGQVMPRVGALRATLDRLDPEYAALAKELDEIVEQCRPRGRVRDALEQGLEQVRDLLERNPDWEPDRFVPDSAYEVLDSKLINFDPDAWLERVADLAPIRTRHNRDDVLPMQVRLRIEELYRAYVFGCWFSVLALTRAILEYAILDNLHKFEIDSRWPPLGQDPNGKIKTLAQLVEEVAAHLPLLRDSMERLREYGNDYLHPKKTQVSKEMLLRRQANAKDALSAMVNVVEGLYLAQGQAVPPS